MAEALELEEQHPDAEDVLARVRSLRHCLLRAAEEANGLAAALRQLPDGSLGAQHATSLAACIAAALESQRFSDWVYMEALERACEDVAANLLPEDAHGN